MKNKPADKKQRSTFHKIVNWFLYFAIGIIVLLLLLLGFSQTKTFRELLRKEVISQVNASINGKLNIGQIDGTIFTSLTLRNTSLVIDADTLFFAKKLAIRTNPAQLIFKNIYIRSFELSDAKIQLLKDTSGVYNFSKLSKPKPKDTTSSKFPFTITVADFRLNNISLKHALYEFKHSNRSYPVINMKDLRLDSLYLALNAEADMDRNNYNLKISGASFKANMKNFWLKDLRGNFYVTAHDANIDYFILKTNTTDFNLAASLQKINLFNNFKVADLKNSPIKFDLDARVFDFSNLVSFSITDFLSGTLKTKVTISGLFGNMKIDRLSLDYLQTHLSATGNIKNLHSPANLFIKADLMDSYINEPDVAELLPNGQIPVYKNLQLKNIKAGFEGSPKNFKSSFSTDLPEGSIAAKADLDFTSAKMKYNVDLETTGLNVEPVAKISTFLNSKASIIGEGVKPNEMAAQIHFSLSNSKIQQYLLDSLNISSTADNGKIIMRMLALSNNAVSSINANLDIRDKNNPVYNAAGNISNLNIRNFIADTSMRSNFNFGFTLKGRSFDFHNMESAFTLNLAKSQFKGINIDPTNLELIYTRPVLGQRLLQFNSDFADLIIRGNYSIDDAAAIIGYESKIISQSIIQKVYEFNPLAIFNDSLKAKDFEAQLQLDKIKFPKIINQNMEVNYSLIIKDLKLVSMLAGVNKIDMDGKIGGVISNDKEAFRNTNNITLKYLKIFAPGNMIYVSDLNFDLDVNRRNTEISFGNIGLNLNLTTGRVFSGTDLKNISLRFGLQNNLLKYSLAAEMDTTIKAQIAGIGDIADNMFKFAIDTLAVDYKKIKFVNDSSLIFAYSKEAFDIKHFSLSRNGSRINLGGSILGIGMLKDLTLKVDNLDAGLIKDITGIKSNIGAKINLLITSNGYFDKPEIKLGLNVDNITAGKVKLGNLQGNLDYANKLLKTDILILDSTLNKTNPALSLTSKIPIDLGIIGVKKRLLDNQPVSIQLKSNNFDLSTFGNLLPYVGNLNGKLIADMNIGGTTSQYIYSGKLDLNDVSFLSRVNNLPYGLDMHIRLDNESISLDNFSLKNTGGTQFGGTLNGSGMLNLKGFDLQNAEVTLSGDLAVLSPASKSTLPAYGDLALQTDGDWRLTYKAGNSSFNGSVLIKNTNLTIVPTQSSYSEGKDAFIFHYVIDSTKIDKKQSEFADVIALSRQYSPLNKPAVKKEKTSFNYNLHVKIQNEAKVIVVVNKELNQQLTVLLGGELFYGSSGVAQGKFSLLEGSNLSFFKTFTAEGSIYFESDITNPRLDIIATYIGNHDVPVAEQNSAGTSEKVAVKIKIQGNVKDLDKNLASSENNIAVYRGQANIDKSEADPQLTAADAISFITIGKFIPELTASEKTQQGNSLAGYQYSILGSLISSFANSQLGDVVNNFELEQRGNETRFGISGKFKNIRYSIGGTTESLQDFTKANLKFEYPFNEKLWFRFERKDPIAETTGLNEKINEIALRYKFSF